MVAPFRWLRRCRGSRIAAPLLLCLLCVHFLGKANLTQSGGSTGLLQPLQWVVGRKEGPTAPRTLSDGWILCTCSIGLCDGLFKFQHLLLQRFYGSDLTFLKVGPPTGGCRLVSERWIGQSCLEDLTLLDKALFLLEDLLVDFFTGCVGSIRRMMTTIRANILQGLQQIFHGWLLRAARRCIRGTASPRARLKILLLVPVRCIGWDQHRLQDICRSLGGGGRRRRSTLGRSQGSVAFQQIHCIQILVGIKFDVHGIVVVIILKVFPHVVVHALVVARGLSVFGCGRCLRRRDGGGGRRGGGWWLFGELHELFDHLLLCRLFLVHGRGGRRRAVLLVRTTGRVSKKELANGIRPPSSGSLFRWCFVVVVGMCCRTILCRQQATRCDGTSGEKMPFWMLFLRLLVLRPVLVLLRRW